MTETAAAVRPGVLLVLGIVCLPWVLGFGYLGGRIVLEQVRETRRRRRALVPPEPAEVIREEHKGADRRWIVSLLRFTTVEGEQIVTEVTTRNPLAGPGHAPRISYDPRDPRRVITGPAGHAAMTLGALVCFALCGAAVAFFLVVLAAV